MLESKKSVPIQEAMIRHMPFHGLTGSSRTEFQKSIDINHVYVKGKAAGDRPRKGAIRIVSWNIERGHDVRQLGEALIALEPDIVCLQEVDWGNGRAGGRDVLQELAAQTGMLGLFGVEFIEIANADRPAELAGGGVTGNAILTRLEPHSAFRIELPAPLDWENGASDAALPRAVRKRIRREPRVGKRFGLAAGFSWGGRELFTASLHLEDKFGGVQGRWSQYLAAMKALNERGDHRSIRVAAGDMNTFNSWMARLYSPDSNADALGKPRLRNEATWWKTALLPKTGYADPFDPSDWTFCVPPLFYAKLDWITTSNSAVRNFGQGPFAASDHRSLWVDIEL